MSTTRHEQPLPGSSGWRLDPKFAHPRAYSSFQESFFWDGIDDHAPWGSDEGADALAAFGQAHDSSGSAPAMMEFVTDYVGSKWSQMPPDENLPDPAIEELSVGHMEVIAIVLGMYLLHGYVPPELKELGLDAINRELEPRCLNLFGAPDDRANKLRTCRDRLLQAETTPPLE